MRNPLRSGAIAPVLPLVAFLLIGSPAAASSRSPWLLEIGGGMSAVYAYESVGSRFAFDSEPMGFAPFATVSMERSLASPLSIRFDLGFASQEHRVGFMMIPEQRPWTTRLGTQLLPISLGMRLEAMRPGHMAVPFVQVSPTLFLVRVSERTVTAAGYDFGSGEYHPEEVAQASSVKGVPGLIASAGWRTRVVGPLSLATSVRYLYSADIGRIELRRVRGEFGRIHEGNLSMAVLLRL